MSKRVPSPHRQSQVHNKFTVTESATDFAAEASMRPSKPWYERPVNSRSSARLVREVVHTIDPRGAHAPPRELQAAEAQAKASSAVLEKSNPEVNDTQ